MKHWFLQLLIAIDQLINVLVTPFSAGAWADETLSSRAWRMEQKRRPWGIVMRPLIDKLFFFQNSHCRNAFIDERMGRQLPPEARSIK